MSSQIETKAWKVWNPVDWEIHPNRNDLHSLLDVETIYAHSRGIAMRKFISKNAVPKSEQKQIKTARYENDDLVLTDEYPNGVRKSVFEYIKKEEVRISKRKEFVESQPDDTLFYIQKSGFVGNCMLFWAKGGCGYTTDIKNAQIYTKQQVLDNHIKQGEEHIIWVAYHIEHVASKMVDFHKTDSAFSIN